MLSFLAVLVMAVAALLAVQVMDIEAAGPSAIYRIRPSRPGVPLKLFGSHAG